MGQRSTKEADDSPMRESYSLVLHDDTPHSNVPEMERLLAAHVTYNLLTSSHFFVSDNQIIGTRNFRRLLRHNTTIRRMVEAKSIVVLVRDKWDWHPQWESDTKDAAFYWDAIQNSFIRNGKMRTSPDFYSIKHELEFLEKNAATDSWSYRSISDNFSRLLRNNLTSRLAQEQLGDALYERVSSLIDQEIAEKPAGDSLGTTFVQDKLLTALGSEGILLSDQQRSFLRSCYIGPYAANLPDAKRLLPQYTDDLAEAFDIMRGCKLEWSEPETETIKARSLRSSFLVEGLLQLTPDDIDQVRDGFAFKRFNALSANENDRVEAAKEISLAYRELRSEIEEKIVKRLDPSATLAFEDNPLQSTIRWFKGDTASSLGGEAVSIAINHAAGALLNATIPLVGFAAEQIFGRIKKRQGIDERSRGRRDVHAIDEAIERLGETYEEKILHLERLDETGGKRKISEVYLPGSK
ncbi:MAG: hypothetical protein KDK03_05135 [Rhodobacteraceae bacterium]|nr:hypothetical protein [Paracoccaceae bacterium]